jgi:hypothetical protein
LGFAYGVMSETEERSWSTRVIDRYFGQQTTDISQWLRKTLLICVDESYRFNIPGEKKGICKKYLLNSQGVSDLKRLLNIADIPVANNKSKEDPIHSIIKSVAQVDHTEELNTGNFVYKDQSHRLWHPLQRYRRPIRKQILSDAGYQHQYDIQCCAPTLIHQYSQTIPEIINTRGKWQQGPMDLYLFALRSYIKDRTQIRKHYAEQMEISIDLAKEIINSLFAGARIAHNDQSDIYKMLDGDRSRIEFLKQDPYITQLREDIKICWEYIRPVMIKRTKKTSKGTERLLPLTSKQKWNVYFELERIVMNSVRTYLDQRSVRYFLIHDGWSCDREIDREELRKYVRNDTGFDLLFDHQNINYSTIQ